MGLLETDFVEIEAILYRKSGEQLEEDKKESVHKLQVGLLEAESWKIVNTTEMTEVASPPVSHR